MTEYVLVCCYDKQRDIIVMIVKSSPEWQKGRLNLPGGKIEPGETPEIAAARELLEETGFIPFMPIEVMGTIQGESCVVYCCKAICDILEEFRPRSGEKELPVKLTWREVKNHPLVIPNLRVIIPLIQSGISGWEIKDNSLPSNSEFHKIEISIPTFI